MIPERLFKGSIDSTTVNQVEKQTDEEDVSIHGKVQNDSNNTLVSLMTLSPNCKSNSLEHLDLDLKKSAEIKHFSPPNSPKVSFNKSLMNNVLSAQMRPCSVQHSVRSKETVFCPPDINASDKGDLPGAVLGSCIGSHSESYDDAAPEKVITDDDKPPHVPIDKAGLMSEKKTIRKQLNKKKDGIDVDESCDIEVTELSQKKETLEPKEKDFTLLGARPKIVQTKKKRIFA